MELYGFEFDDPGPDRFKSFAKLAAVALLAAALCAAVLNFAVKARAGSAAAAALLAAQQRTGRETVAAGFGGTIFTGFYLRGVRVAGDAPDDPASVSIPKLLLPLSFPALLNGKLRFGDVRLERPAIRVERSEAGDYSVADAIDKLFGPAPLPYPGQRTFDCERISVRDGSIDVKINRAGGKPVDFSLTNINGGIAPPSAKRTGPAKISLSADFGSIRFHISGHINSRRADALDLKWKTENLLKGAPPKFLREAAKTERLLRFGGLVAAQGKLTGDPLTPRITGFLKIKNFSAFDLEFDSGTARFELAAGMLRASGKIGIAGARLLVFEGGASFAGDTNADVYATFSGIEADAAMSRAAPEFPKLIDGVMGGFARISGPFLDPADLKIDASITVKDGNLMYPTPTISGQQDAWAPIAFDSLTLQVGHERPKVTISKAVLAGKELAASGDATFIYGKNLLNGRAAGPVWIDARVQMASPQIGAVFARNQYLGPLLSGAATATAQFKGRSDSPDTFEASFSFDIANGEIITPYDHEASRLPNDAKLLRFSFNLLSGSFDVANEVFSAKKLYLRGRAVNADIFGMIGFNGELKARVVTGLDPGLIMTVKDLREDYKQPKDMSGIERIKASFEAAGTLRQPQLKWDVDEFKQTMIELGRKVKTDNMLKKVNKKRASKQPRGRKR